MLSSINAPVPVLLLCFSFTPCDASQFNSFIIFVPKLIKGYALSIRVLENVEMARGRLRHYLHEAFTNISGTKFEGERFYTVLVQCTARAFWSFIYILHVRKTGKLFEKYLL
jgi:hypothetical protein